MTKDEAIKFLKMMREAIDRFAERGHDRTSFTVDNDRSEALDMAIEALSEQKWTPCCERLPKNVKEVLVCFQNGWIDIASYRANRICWKLDGDFANCGDIVAWMPLPKPYERREI